MQSVSQAVKIIIIGICFYDCFHFAIVIVNRDGTLVSLGAGRGRHLPMPSYTVITYVSVYYLLYIMIRLYYDIVSVVIMSNYCTVIIVYL